MYTNQTCDEHIRLTNAERYASQRMTVEEAETFEDHFVTCAECQAEVRFVSAVAGSFGGAAEPAPALSRTRRRGLVGGVALALAAGLVALMISRSQPRGELVALGGVREPPVYLGVPVRSQGARSDSVFNAAMDAYARREFPVAAAGLRATLALDPGSVPAQFFLATSLLLDDHPRDAVDAFGRVLARGDTPYRAEARYYRAKALLRMGRGDDARADLAALTRADGAAFEMAAALADSVARLRGR